VRRVLGKGLPRQRGSVCAKAPKIRA
jgi:putative Mg2+ transporter-C (MgtC) family protein